MRKKKNVVTNGIQEMTREELTRTQVLNLSDFEKVAEFEKLFLQLLRAKHQQVKDLPSF